MPALGVVNLPLFAATVLIVNATPGVDLLFTLGRTLQGGVRSGLAAAAGIGAGCVLHALAATFGLAALLAASAPLFDALKAVGAAYLLWLAVGMARAALKRDAGRAEARIAGRVAATPGASVPAVAAPGAVFRQGLLTNALNPKVALFFLALLPQFIAADAPHKTLAFLLLGGWFVLQGGLFLGLFVLTVAPLRQVRMPSLVVRGLHALGALVFVSLALRLLRTSR